MASSNSPRAARALPRSRCVTASPGSSLDGDAEVLGGHVGPATLHRQPAEVVMQSPVVRRFGDCRLVGLPSRLQGLRRRCQPEKVVPPLTCCGLANVVVELIGEWSSGRHIHHRRRPTGIRPTESAPAIPRIAAATGLALLGQAGQLRQGRADLVENGPGEQVVSVEGQVDVLIEQFLARNANRGPDRFRPGPARRRPSGRRRPLARRPPRGSTALMRESARNRRTSRSRANSNRSRASARRPSLIRHTPMRN